MVQIQDDLTTRLQDFITDRSGQPTKILDAEPLAGGASRDTWVFTAQIGDQEQKLVLRRDTPSQMFDEALTRAQEYYLMKAAYEQGVTVAEVLWLCEDASVLDFPFFIMKYIPGNSLGRVVMHKPVFDAARQMLPNQMADELAKIHAMDVTAPQFAFLKRPQPDETPEQVAIDEMLSILDQINVANPVWEWTLRWAENNKPDPTDLTFVHGDFRIGNILVHPERGLTGVIDWEFGHIGNPDEELGYLCMRDWRFGHGTKRAAGLTDRESFITHYEAASNRTVDRASVDWWEVMGNIRWGIICLSQANRHLSGDEPSVEMASLGRRSAEMQYETLRLIESCGMFAK